MLGPDGPKHRLLMAQVLEGGGRWSQRAIAWGAGRMGSLILSAWLFLPSTSSGGRYSGLRVIGLP